jgi:hypothetical protein
MRYFAPLDWRRSLSIRLFVSSAWQGFIGAAAVSAKRYPLPSVSVGSQSTSDWLHWMIVFGVTYLVAAARST